ncbi:unnamed protein product, partial [Ilex paraguariensis]
QRFLDTTTHCQQNECVSHISSSLVFRSAKILQRERNKEVLPGEHLFSERQIEEQGSLAGN